jgi:hypothetical protein
MLNIKKPGIKKSHIKKPLIKASHIQNYLYTPQTVLLDLELM